MDNNQHHSETENIISENTPEQKPKITLINRYIHLSEPHNRINRSTFLVNMIIFWFLYIVLEGIPFVHIIFTLLYIVQVTKRFHDFGKSGYWTLWVILYHIVFAFWFMHFILINIAPMAISVAGTLFIIAGTFIIPWIPDIILMLIPGDKEANKYGKPQKM